MTRYSNFIGFKSHWYIVITMKTDLRTKATIEETTS